MPGDIDISPQRFEQQLRWLSRWRKVAKLDETLSSHESKRLTAITFDDGFRDNLTVALPLLEKYGLPMTLFVTAGFIDRDGYLSTQELREISMHPLVTIGAHGLWNRNFTRLSADEARLELVESRWAGRNHWSHGRFDGLGLWRMQPRAGTIKRGMRIPCLVVSLERD